MIKNYKRKFNSYITTPDDSKKRHLVVSLVILVIIVILSSGLYLRFEWNRYQAAAEREAIQLAQSVESLLHIEHIAELSGSPDDLENPV